MLPDKITEAPTIEDCMIALGSYIPSDVYANCYNAFHGILRRAYELGYIGGKEYEKERLRIQLGLNPTEY